MNERHSTADQSKSEPLPAADTDPDSLPTQEGGNPSASPSGTAGENTQFGDQSLDSMFELSDVVGGSSFSSADVDPSLDGSPQLVPIRLTAGQQIGAFQLLEPIGHGGMGVVFKASDLRLNRIVALKILLAHVFTDDTSLRRFLSEARAAGALDHPSIVPVYDVGEANGCHYIVMAYVDGESLAQRLQRNAAPLPPGDAARWVEEIGLAAAHSHANAIVHRDLKPANVLIDAQDRVRVTDFGLARELNSNDDLTRTGQVMGTPGFMSPEAAGGESREIGPAADIYGMGAVLYCLLVNRPPFQAATPLETIRQVITSDVVPPRQLDPSIPKDLETICVKALEKEPGRRYASAQEMVDDLRRFQDGAPIKARPMSRLAKAARWVKRHKPAAAMTVLAVFACIASVAALGFWNQNRFNQQAAADAAKSAKLAEQLAQTQEYYSLVSGAKHHIAQRAPGWSWGALEKLEQASANPSAARDALDLRNASAECLRTLDYRFVPTLVDDMTIADLAFSPDGRRLAIAEMKRQDAMRVRIYDTSTWKLQRKFNVPILGENLQRLFGGHSKFQEGIRRLTFSPNGTWLVAGTRHGKLFAMNLAEQESEITKWQGHDSQINQLEFSADGTTLYSLDDNPRLKQWNVGDWSERNEDSWLPSDVDQIAIDPTGVHIAIDDGKVFEAASGRSIDRPDARLQTIGFSRDGRFLCGKIADKPSYLIHELATGQSRVLYTDAQMNSYPNYPLHFDGTTTWFLSNGYDERVALFDFCSREKIGEIPTPGRDEAPAAADPGGRYFVVALAVGVAVYEVRGRDYSFALDGELDPIQALDVSAFEDRCVVLSERGTDVTSTTVAAYRLPDREPLLRRRFSAPAGETFHRPRTPRTLALSEENAAVVFTSAIVPPLAWDLGDGEFATAGIHESEENAFHSFRGESLAALVMRDGDDEDAAASIGPLRLEPAGADDSLVLRLPPVRETDDGRYLYLNVRTNHPNSKAKWRVSLSGGKGNATPLPDVKDVASDWRLVPVGFVPHGCDRVEIRADSIESSEELWIGELLLARVRDKRPAYNLLEDGGPVAVGGDQKLLWTIVDEDQLFAWQASQREPVFHWNNRPALTLQGVSRINALATSRDWTIAGTRAGQAAVIAHQSMEVERIVDGPGSPVTACVIAGDQGIVGTQEGTVRIIALGDGKIIQDLPPFRREIASVDVSRDGTWLVVAAKETGLRLYYRSGAEYELYLEQTGNVALARLTGDGERLVVLLHNEHAPRVWQLDRLKRLWSDWDIR